MPIGWSNGLGCRSEPGPRLIACEWMKEEGLAASTHSMILSTIRSLQQGTRAIPLSQGKVPVWEEVFSREEIKKMPVDLRSNKE